MTNTANFLLNNESLKVFQDQNKTRMLTFINFNQHSFGSPSAANNQKIKISKISPNWKESSKTAIVHIRPIIIHRKS